MLSKIGSAGFSILIVFGLFLALHSVGFAQRAFERDYTEIVKNYKESSLHSNKSEMEYQGTVRFEGEIYKNVLDELKKIYLTREEYYEGEKQKCKSGPYWHSKSECIQAMDRHIQEEASRYIQALKEAGKIWEDRKSRLDEARKKFTPSQMKRTPQKRKYERHKDLFI